MATGTVVIVRRMKILAAIPMSYSHNGGFWQRDLGLVVLALRALGHEAYFVALGEESEPSEWPLKLITRGQMADPAWWKAQAADGIILNTWAATRFDDIRRAALSAGCPVIEKLDTDGVRTPRMFPGRYLRCELVRYDLRYPFSQGLVALMRGILRTLAVWAIPSLLDERIVRCLAHVPMLAAETPVAAARMQRFLRLYQATPMPQIRTIPHPVDMTHIGFGEGDVKENQVIAVGRWDAAVKGWPLLKDITTRFLDTCQNWKVIVVGSGASEEGAALKRKYGDRFQMPGHQGHVELSKYLRAAKIYLLTSHYESFNIAGAEALCSGCSVVAPSQIPSAGYFAGKSSGTSSHTRTPDQLTDALIAETMEWEQGRRNPSEISRAWKRELSAESVARRFSTTFESWSDLPQSPQSFSEK